MALIWALLFTAAGLILSVLGSDWLIRGASRLARALGVPPLLVGLTVVAWGTSLPELAVSLEAALVGNPALAMGNVVGSNIFNVLFILGASALITPIAVAHRIVRNDLPIMVGASLLAWGLAADGVISRLDGLLLGAGLLAWTLFLFWEARSGKVALPTDGADKPPGSRLRAAGLAVAGLTVMVGGSHLLLRGALDLARLAGVGEQMIGLTLVAGGTSLPELFASVIAAWRGERDIAVGNVVGSNIFNLFAVLGVSGSIAGAVDVSAFLAVDLPLMCAVAVCCFPVFYTGAAVSRAEGALFLASWAGYVAWMACVALAPSAAPTVGVVACAVGGVAVLGLVVLTVLEWRRRRVPG